MPETAEISDQKHKLAMNNIRYIFVLLILFTGSVALSGCYGEGFLSVSLEKPGANLKKTCSETVAWFPIVGDLGKEAADKRLEECARRYEEKGFVVNEKESHRN